MKQLGRPKRSEERAWGPIRDLDPDYYGVRPPRMGSTLEAAIDRMVGRGGQKRNGEPMGVEL